MKTKIIILACVLFTGILFSQNNTKTKKMTQSNFETITLGGGCYWCVEAVYENLKGVKSVVSGFSGGKILNPSYEEVCSGTTGHAEVVQITFDKNVTSLDEIFKVFFTVHDPTTLNRQGADRGTQYRSVIYYHSPLQKTVAEEVKLASKEIWDDPIVTEISAFDKFYVATRECRNARETADKIECDSLSF